MDFPIFFPQGRGGRACSSVEEHSSKVEMFELFYEIKRIFSILPVALCQKLTFGVDEMTSRGHLSSYFRISLLYSTEISEFITPTIDKNSRTIET